MVWVAGRYFATVIVCFSFALTEFGLKRFLSFFDCFMPAALSRFGSRWPNLEHWPSLARWPSTLLARWVIVEPASSTNIPLTMALN